MSKGIKAPGTIEKMSDKQFIRELLTAMIENNSAIREALITDLAPESQELADPKKVKQQLLDAINMMDKKQLEKLHKNLTQEIEATRKEISSNKNEATKPNTSTTSYVTPIVFISLLLTTVTEALSLYTNQPSLENNNDKPGDSNQRSSNSAPQQRLAEQQGVFQPNPTPAPPPPPRTTTPEQSPSFSKTNSLSHSSTLPSRTRPHTGTHPKTKSKASQDRSSSPSQTTSNTNKNSKSQSSTSSPSNRTSKSPSASPTRSHSASVEEIPQQGQFAPNPEFIVEVAALVTAGMVTIGAAVANVVSSKRKDNALKTMPAKILGTGEAFGGVQAGVSILPTSPKEIYELTTMFRVVPNTSYGIGSLTPLNVVERTVDGHTNLFLSVIVNAMKCNPELFHRTYSDTAIASATFHANNKNFTVLHDSSGTLSIRKNGKDYEQITAEDVEDFLGFLEDELKKKKAQALVPGVAYDNNIQRLEAYLRDESLRIKDFNNLISIKEQLLQRFIIEADINNIGNIVALRKGRDIMSEALIRSSQHGPISRAKPSRKNGEFGKEPNNFAATMSKVTEFYPNPDFKDGYDFINPNNSYPDSSEAVTFSQIAQGGRKEPIEERRKLFAYAAKALEENNAVSGVEFAKSSDGKHVGFLIGPRPQFNTQDMRIFLGFNDQGNFLCLNSSFKGQIPAQMSEEEIKIFNNLKFLHEASLDEKKAENNVVGGINGNNGRPQIVPAVAVDPYAPSPAAIVDGHRRHRSTRSAQSTPLITDKEILVRKICQIVNSRLSQNRELNEHDFFFYAAALALNFGAENSHPFFTNATTPSITMPAASVNNGRVKDRVVSGLEFQITNGGRRESYLFAIEDDDSLRLFRRNGQTLDLISPTNQNSKNLIDHLEGMGISCDVLKQELDNIHLTKLAESYIKPGTNPADAKNLLQDLISLARLPKTQNNSFSVKATQSHDYNTITLALRINGEPDGFVAINRDGTIARGTPPQQPNAQRDLRNFLSAAPTYPIAIAPNISRCAALQPNGALRTGVRSVTPTTLAPSLIDGCVEPNPLSNRSRQSTALQLTNTQRTR